MKRVMALVALGLLGLIISCSHTKTDIPVTYRFFTGGQGLFPYAFVDFESTDSNTHKYEGFSVSTSGEYKKILTDDGIVTIVTGERAQFYYDDNEKRIFAVVRTPLMLESQDGAREVYMIMAEAFYFETRKWEKHGFYPEKYDFWNIKQTIDSCQQDNNELCGFKDRKDLYDRLSSIHARYIKQIKEKYQKL